MKYPKGHKAAVGQKLRRQAARQIRHRGIDGTSVKSVMGAENMTVGGFYAHFESRQDMLAEGIRAAFAESRAFHRQLLESTDDPEWQRKLIGTYLSTRHRDHRPSSCPVACLSGEVALADERLRQVFEQELLALADLYEKRLAASGRACPKDLSLPLLSLLSGALQLSRAVDDEALSARILEDGIRAARKLLETP